MFVSVSLQSISAADSCSERDQPFLIDNYVSYHQNSGWQLNPDITHSINFMAHGMNKKESFRTRNNLFNWTTPSNDSFFFLHACMHAFCLKESEVSLSQTKRKWKMFPFQLPLASQMHKKGILLLYNFKIPSLNGLLSFKDYNILSLMITCSTHSWEKDQTSLAQIHLTPYNQ